MHACMPALYTAPHTLPLRLAIHCACGRRSSGGSAPLLLSFEAVAASRRAGRTPSFDSRLRFSMCSTTSATLMSARRSRSDWSYLRSQQARFGARPTSPWLDAAWQPPARSWVPASERALQSTLLTLQRAVSAKATPSLYSLLVVVRSQIRPLVQAAQQRRASAASSQHADSNRGGAAAT